MSEMGHKQTSRDVRVTSALPPIADIRRMSWHVRFVPKADIENSSPKTAESCWAYPRATGQTKSSPAARVDGLFRTGDAVIGLRSTDAPRRPRGHDADAA